MEYDYWTIDLPRTAGAWRAGRDDIETILIDELGAQAADLLGDACASTGGWPDDEQVDVNRIQADGDRMEIAVTVYFTEVIPSSCKDMPHREDRQVDLVLKMDRSDDFAFVDHSPTGPEQWDLWERNSAADGA